MFDDPKKELEQLEKQLLREEDGEWLENQLAQARALLDNNGSHSTPSARSGRAPASRSNAQIYDYDDPDPYEQELPKKKGIGCLVLIALAETLAIAAILAYWFTKFL